VRRLLLIAAAATALGLGACADENDDEPDTQTDTAPVVTAEETEATTDTQEAGTEGEVADLPLCDDTGTVRPCRTEGGAVLEEGGANAGEVSDLPLCSEAAPPCRNPDGSFVEP
jgi:hypothetical protein